MSRVDIRVTAYTASIKNDSNQECDEKLRKVEHRLLTEFIFV